MEKKWMTVKEVCDYCGCSIAQVREWCRDGTVQAHRSGASWKILSTSLPCQEEFEDEPLNLGGEPLHYEPYDPITEPSDPKGIRI